MFFLASKVLWLAADPVTLLMACALLGAIIVRRAPRAGRVLTIDEMRALLIQMDEFTFSSFCPHGRPVSVRWGLSELERLFKRIV